MDPKFEIKKVFSAKKNNLWNGLRVYKLDIFNIKNNITINDFNQVDFFIRELFNVILRETFNYESNSYISFFIESDELQNPIYISPSKVENINSNQFIQKLVKVSQSNRSFLLDGNLRIKTYVMKEPDGHGLQMLYRRKDPYTYHDFIKSKNCIIKVDGRYHDCFFRAICMGYLLCKKKLTPAIKRNSFELLTKECKSFFEKFKIDTRQTVTTKTFNIVQQILSNFNIQLYVVSGIKNKFNILFAGPLASKQIVLLRHEIGHFDLIKNMSSYLNAYSFCFQCNEPQYSNLKRCIHYCQACLHQKICYGNKITCLTCNRTFNGIKCYNNHMEICTKYKKCVKCELIYVSEKILHKCYHVFCKKCKEYYQGVHNCYLPKKENKISTHPIFGFYDFEAKSINEHEVICGVLQFACDECYDSSSNNVNTNCSYCGRNKYVYTSDSCDVVSSMMDDILIKCKKISNTEDNVYLIAHNARGYDAHFILRELLRRKIMNLNIITNGTKLLRVQVGNLVIIDSLCFLPMPLARLPKSFGIKTLKKGDFPHLLSNNVNMDYRQMGLPSIEYYSLGYKNLTASKELENWYSEETKKYQEKEWIFKNELVEYCQNDVEILQKAFLAFRHLVMNINQFDPIRNNFTLASLVMETFQTNFVIPKTIAITPPTGIYDKTRNSIAAEVWIRFQEMQNNITIIREVKIGPYYVDGICENTVYEFNGCYYHGCPNCYDKNTQILGSSSEIIYSKYLKKADYIRQQGFNLISTFECQWNQYIQMYNLSHIISNLRKNLIEIKRIGPINCRDALFGGRVENFKFLYNTMPDENIRYLDFTSLYPFVLKTKTYPIGHPIVVENCSNIDYTLQKYKLGIIKCRIIPPKQLYLPVLPIKHDKKLVFALCQSCLSTETEKISNDFYPLCQHNNKERCFTGTWCIAEVKLAIEKGYQIDYIYQIYHFEQVSNGLFKEFIDTFLKIKQQASGYPNWVKTEEDKDKYVNNYYIHEGIKLDKKEIAYNAGLRTISKLILNSLWGKMAQRNNLTKTQIITHPKDWYEIYQDETNEIIEERQIDDNNVLVTFKKKTESLTDGGKNNLIIAAHVTAYARIELYRLLDTIQQERENRILYCDTDSVIFVQKSIDNDNLNIGDFLGNLTDEIVDSYGANSKVISFASMGPKCYAFQTQQSDGTIHTSFKMKGITITRHVDEILNYDLFSKMISKAVFNNKYEALSLPQFNIVRDKDSLKLYSRYNEKKLKVTSSKRRMLSNADSIPFGY